MSCPTCGGNDREQIAPGYWRCLSLRIVREAGPGSVGLPGPPEFVREWACGTEYQEGNALQTNETCQCGTFAIGFCTNCKAPVCGTHSALKHGNRLCGTCFSEQLAEEEKQAEVSRRWEEANKEALLARRKSAKAKSEVSARKRIATTLALLHNAGNPGALPVISPRAGASALLPVGRRTTGWLIGDFVKINPPDNTEYGRRLPRTETKGIVITTQGDFVLAKSVSEQKHVLTQERDFTRRLAMRQIEKRGVIWGFPDWDVGESGLNLPVVAGQFEDKAKALGLTRPN